MINNNDMELKRLEVRLSRVTTGKSELELSLMEIDYKKRKIEESIKASDEAIEDIKQKIIELKE